MELCARCKKRLAVVYIQRIENGDSKSEGICLKCAKELGIKPINDMMAKMGIGEEELDRLDEEMEGLVESGELSAMSTDDEGRAPAVDFSKIFGGLGGKPKGEKKDESKGDKEKSKKFLSEYCDDLTAKAREGKLDKIVGREREIGRLIQILCRRQKNNPCLIGEPGVGKTAIAEALAQRIATGEVPYKLKNKEVHLVDLTALVAGTQFRGQFEQRIKGLIKEVKKLGNIILVIDEVHSIVGAGDAEGSMNAANILKPALSRGEIQLIGATTLTEYRKYIEKDSALERRFQSIIVEEPSIEDSVKMLTGIKGYYESFHGVNIPEGIVRSAVILSERYITERFLPDKAIDLLDEASAHLSLSSPVLEKLNFTVDRMAAIKAEREFIESQDVSDDEAKLQERYKKLADIKAEESRLSADFEELAKEKEHVVLTDEDLARVIEIWTGIPASSITENEYVRIDSLASNLRKKIVGQDKAIDALSRAIKRNRAGVSTVRKPVSFIFAGPTGVGKTALVKALAAELFDSPETLIRLDMSEFMEKHSVSRIIGSPPGYVGYDDAGQLTEKIRRKPYSVVLFDEIEKAHPDVLNVMLQILDDGRITDAQGRTVNFENTVIVMTTNAGSNINVNYAGFSEVKGFGGEDKTMKALSDFLRPEFLNRVDEIVTFMPLDKDDFAGIAVIMLGELAAALSEKGIVLKYTSTLTMHIARESYSEKFGARNMRRYIQNNLEDKIADIIISSHGKTPDCISVDVRENEIVFESI